LVFVGKTFLYKIETKDGSIFLLLLSEKKIVNLCRSIKRKIFLNENKSAKEKIARKTFLEVGEEFALEMAMVLLTIWPNEKGLFSDGVEQL